MLWFYVVFLKLAILIAVLRLMLRLQSPITCGVVYAVVALFFRMMLGFSVEVLIISSVVGVGLSLLYFWAVDRLQGWPLVWWPGTAFGAIVLACV